jgi:molecular chaperone DnaK
LPPLPPLPPRGAIPPFKAPVPTLPSQGAVSMADDPPLPPGAEEPPLPMGWQDAPAPVLVDVTPRALVVETVGGYCDIVIPRNARIPCEHTRAFATGRDLQTTVHVRVAQGEEQRFERNQYLGELELSDLRPAPRGEIVLKVTFELDANGSLLVRAVDSSTGRQTQAKMKLIAVNQSEEAIEEMIERSRSVSIVG